MTIKDILYKRNGAYSLPFLICLKNNDTALYFVNSRSDVTHGNKLFKASAFSYSSETSSNGFGAGGTLEIATKENGVFELLETSTKIELEVIGIIDNGEITELKKWKHKYCKAEISREKIKLTFGADDRPQMQFPSMIFSTINNRGNS